MIISNFYYAESAITMTQEYQLKPFLAHAGITRMKQQEPGLHRFIFQQPTNIQNLSHSTGFDYTRTKNPTRATVKTLAAIEKQIMLAATKSLMSAIVWPLKFPVGKQ